MAETDYKIRKYELNARGTVTKIEVAFYTGVTSQQSEVGIDGVSRRVTRYRRSALRGIRTWEPNTALTFPEMQRALNLKISQAYPTDTIIPEERDVTGAIDIGNSR